MQISRGARRGLALAGTLALAALLLLVALALAAVCLNSLQVAQGFHDGARGDLIARAVAEQFAAEFQGTGSAGSPLQGNTGVDFLARYRDEPVFPDGGEHLGAEVSVTFDPSKPYYSVDNSQSQIPAAGWADRGTLRKSIPPYAVSLVTSVKTGQQVQHYEAILQRRWPYALTVDDTVVISGTPRVAEDDTPIDDFLGASSVYGPLFLTGTILSESEPSPGTLTIDTSADGTRPEPVVPLDNDMFEQVSRSQAALIQNKRVTLGQNRRIVNTARGTEYLLASKGNRLEGRIDMGGGARSDGTPRDAANMVVVHPDNFWEPQEARIGVGTRDQLRQLGRQLFRMPDSGQYQEVTGLKPLPENPGSEASGARTFYLLENDLTLQGPYRTDLHFGAAARYVIPGSAGNRYLGVEKIIETDPDTGHETIRYEFEVRQQTGKSLQLKDCMLYVDGSLDLSADPDQDTYPPWRARRSGEPLPDPPPLPGLRGSNATLVVNGSLIISHGLLDARDRGMVVYCQRLVMKARGHYRGAILAEEGALIYPGGPIEAPDGLRIDGALICGGQPFRVLRHGSYRPPRPPIIPTPSPTPSGSPTPSPDPSASASPSPSPEPSPSESPSPTPSPSPSPGPTGTLSELDLLWLNGIRLWHTELHYDPRYLKSIHQFGDFHLLSVRKLP